MNNNLFKIVNDNDIETEFIKTDKEEIMQYNHHNETFYKKRKILANDQDYADNKFNDNNIFNFNQASTEKNANEIFNSSNNQDEIGLKAQTEGLFRFKSSILNRQRDGNNNLSQRSRLKGSSFGENNLRKEKNDRSSTKNETSNINEVRDEKTEMKDKEKRNYLPYRSIDCIFNKKNIWINLQNPNPEKIVYDIWDESKWYPLNFYLNREGNVNGKEEDEDPLLSSIHKNNFDPFKKKSKNSVEFIDKDKLKKDFLINMEDIPAFYNFKDLIIPYSDEKLVELKNNILDKLKYYIEKCRNEMMLPTSVKNVTEKTSNFMLKIEK